MAHDMSEIEDAPPISNPTMNMNPTAGFAKRREDPRTESTHIPDPGREKNGYSSDEFTAPPKKKMQDAAPTPEKSEPLDDASINNYDHDYVIDTFFPQEEHRKQFKDVFQRVVKEEQELYLTTLKNYSTNFENPQQKTLGVESRLVHFEGSEVFKASGLKVKLSDLLKQAASDLHRQNHRPEQALGGPESPTGLSKGEGGAAQGAVQNGIKAAENVVNGGASLASAFTGLAHGLTSLVTDPIKGTIRAGNSFVEQMKKDNIPRHEKIAQDGIKKSIASLDSMVSNFHDLPPGTSKEVIKPLMTEIENTVGKVNDQIRAQGKAGVTNLLDDSLSDKQRGMIKSSEEVMESGEKNTAQVSGILEKFASSPCLEGPGKEDLKTKAKAMAAEAAEMIRKIIESIKTMFDQGARLKAEAPTPPTVIASPRM